MKKVYIFATCLFALSFQSAFADTMKAVGKSQLCVSETGKEPDCVSSNVDVAIDLDEKGNGSWTNLGVQSNGYSTQATVTVTKNEVTGKYLLGLACTTSADDSKSKDKGKGKDDGAPQCPDPVGNKIDSPMDCIHQVPSLSLDCGMITDSSKKGDITVDSSFAIGPVQR